MAAPTFAEALITALDGAGLAKKDIAAAVGVSAQALSNWAAGRDEPSPAKVFALEQALGVRAGTLSRLLGYLPLDAKSARTVIDAIDADPALTEDARRVLRAAYREAAK